MHFCYMASVNGGEILRLVEAGWFVATHPTAFVDSPQSFQPSKYKEGLKDPCKTKISLFHHCRSVQWERLQVQW